MASAMVTGRETLNIDNDDSDNDLDVVETGTAASSTGPAPHITRVQSTNNTIKNEPDVQKKFKSKVESTLGDLHKARIEIKRALNTSGPNSALLKEKILDGPKTVQTSIVGDLDIPKTSRSSRIGVLEFWEF